MVYLLKQEALESVTIHVLWVYPKIPSDRPGMVPLLRYQCLAIFNKFKYKFL